MVTFIHMAWWTDTRDGKYFGSRMKEKERLEFDSDNIQEVFKKARELSDAGWFEVIIKFNGFYINYDPIWEGNYNG